MRWQTGIVMERVGRHVVIMTPEGEFKRVRLKGKNPDIGQEIRVPVQNNLFFTLPKASWIAVAAAVIIFMIASPLLTMINQPAEVAVAYVSIDINPSVELTVSNLDNVLAAKSYNTDGERVLTGLDIIGTKYQKAVSDIGKRAVKLGFLGKNASSTFVISVSPFSNAKIDKVAMENSLLSSANAVLASNSFNVDVKTLHIPVALRERATEKGLSPAKYAVLVEAVTAGLSLTEKDMQEKSIEVAIASAGGEPEQIINQAQDEEKFEDKEQKYFEILGRHNSTISLEENGESGDQINSTALVSVAEKAAGDSSVKPSEDTAKPGKKKPVEDPAKNVNQETPKDPNNQNNGQSQQPSGVVSSGGTSSNAGAPAGTPSSPGDSGNISSPNDTGSDDNQNDDNSEDVYMGPSIDRTDNDSDQDMNLLKPNF